MNPAKPMVCAEAGPACRGDVKQYMNWRACLTHSPAARAGHPEPPTPDPAWGAAAGYAQRLADQRAATAKAAEERNAGMALLRQAAESSRDEALDRVDAAASDEWKDQARRAVWWLANNRRDFTVDDVWERLERLGVRSPQEPRALGPVLMRAVRAGAIRDTGQMAKSRRRHGTKITVYALNPKGTS
jgi:hypothetical protein